MSGFDMALEAIVRISTPLLLAGLGELILERSGMINIGIEGVMLIGAFCGFCGGWIGGSPLIGAAAGMMGGAAVMAIFALFTLRFRADQIVTGMALNLAAMGLTGTIHLAMSHSSDGQMLLAPKFAALSESLARIPFVGPIVFAQTPITLAALLLVPLLWFYLQKSERGLELRAVGENPAAAEASGISVFACRWKACLAAGILGGLGGAFLTVSRTGVFVDNGTRGQGFVALAAVVLGRYGALGTAAACLFFGATFYARDAIPGANVPTDLVEMLPYMLTLIALCLSSRSGAAPAALGKPYQR